ncbi:hypothetical protein [Bythopirellula polymerisocia]|uniref:Dockerin domain-containing protein n=1 Tax=Bythopirellula polymerisocia TaxID=2528003 RepID=A0A5C6CD22_9BACT|nr:hypothetical protein [Bythopirellula polymerisocia]TWU22743.1 hypothetical protein Pla144_42040 [Bythopirellula polymerisocia]
MQRSYSIWGFNLLVSVSSLASGATLHSDDFQTDLSGWTTGGASVSLVTTGGPKGVDDGFLRLESVFGNFAAYNSSSAWVGDFTSIQAAEVTADLMAAVSSAPLSMRLVVFGPGISPATSSRWTSTLAVEVPADGVWRNYAFSLRESDLTRVVGVDNYQSLMGNVLRVMFRHDSGTPSSGGEPVAGDLGLDNITLKSTSLAGDFNNDGAIDGADFLVWQRGGSPASLSAEDLMAWQTNYGLPLGDAPSIAVPEPAAKSLIAMSVPFLRRPGRRRF